MRILLGFLLLTGLMACQPASEKIISISQEIRHDDFHYSVQHVDTTSKPISPKPDGRWWVVTFQVKNEAKLVTHDWTNKTVFITDSVGIVYENQSHEHRRTPAGKTERALLLFDLPRTLTKPYLHVRGETLMGDILDGWQYEKTKVRLF